MDAFHSRRQAQTEGNAKAQLTEIPRNAVTGKDYQGMNMILLWHAFQAKHLDTHDWATFKQWKARNESIRKGEKGTLITGFETTDEEINGMPKTVVSLKLYRVFNRAQLQSWQSE